MLSKLMKHEMKAVTRLLLPIYMVLAAFSIACRIIINLEFNGALLAIPAIIITFYILSLVAISVVSSVIIIIRFYRNLTTDEGYLMFTLPVKPSQLINSKLLISVLWTLLSFIAVFLSITVVLATPASLADLREGLSTAMKAVRDELGASNTALLWIEMIILFISSLFNSVLALYASIAIGQLFHGHKVLGSFAAYIGITMVIQVITIVLASVASIAFPDTFSEAKAIPQIIFPVTVAFMIILSAVYYWLTNFIFSRKLNLE